MKPLITVIVPVYNVKEYLRRCVHSIVIQTYRRLEIILVDDGSTDGTGELCDQLALEDDRIRVYHKKNGGSSSARNYALNLARGEYVGFVDSDDYIEPDMYERLYQGIVQYHVSAAQIGRDETDAEGQRLPNICEPPTEPVIMGDESFLRELLMHRGDCSFCTKLIRREHFPENAFPEGKLNEDFNLLIRMLPKVEKLVSLPTQAYHVFYRIGSNSRKADGESFSRVYSDNVDNADLVTEIVRADYPKLAETAFRFGVFQRLDYLLHIPVSQMNKDNAQYKEIVKYLRTNWLRAMGNNLLTGRDKLYHTLFALAPRGIRVVHRQIFMMRG